MGVDLGVRSLQLPSSITVSGVYADCRVTATTRQKSCARASRRSMESFFLLNVKA